MAAMNSDVCGWARPLHTFNTIRWEDLSGMYSLHRALPGITLGITVGVVYLVEDVAKVCAIARGHVYNNEGRHE